VLLKETHVIPEGWVAKRDARGTLLNEPPVATLEVKHTGTHDTQTFSRDLIDRLIADGVCSMSKGRITLHTAQGDLCYTILRLPGQYLCCHDGVVILGGTLRGDVQREYVATHFPGVSSPDPQNPSGYRCVSGYECILDAEQHAMWNGAAVAGRAAQERGKAG
jgi:hypothetical protein